MKNDTASAPIPQDNIKALVDYVVSRHHEYLRENFPRLLGFSAEVLKGHGQSEPRVAGGRAGR